MVRIIGHSLLSLLLTVWISTTIVFFLLRLLPGDAITTQLRESGAPTETIGVRRAALGLSHPPLEQYAAYITGLMRGDLGVSLLDGQSVSGKIAANLPATMWLAAVAFLLALALGIPLGIVSAGQGRMRIFGDVLLSLSISIPIIWSGTLLLFFAANMSSSVPPPIRASFPAFLLGFHTSGWIGRATEGALRAVQDAPFAQTARAKGLYEGMITRRHLLRAGLSPILTAGALQIGFLLGGAYVTESLFARPGLGRLLIDAVVRQDTPVVQGMVLVSTFAYSLAFLVRDALAGLADPRLRAPIYGEGER